MPIHVCARVCMCVCISATYRIELSPARKAHAKWTCPRENERWKLGHASCISLSLSLSLSLPLSIHIYIRICKYVYAHTKENCISRRCALLTLRSRAIFEVWMYRIIRYMRPRERARACRNSIDDFSLSVSVTLTRFFFLFFLVER